MSRAIVIIPARMASSRLPGKPLADIEGTPMVIHVLRRAEAAAVGPVVVATAEAEIADAVSAAGGRAVATRPDHPSGSDRAYEALQSVDPEAAFEAAINLQGDLPAIEPEAIRAVLEPLSDPAVDIATLAAPIVEPGERHDANVVKAVLALEPGAKVGRALYFSRAAVPAGEGPLYHHIGIYAFRRSALADYVALPPSPLERRENLEQLRALEAGMRIDAALVDTVPLGVDTPADLARIRAIMAAEPA
jgi:3-deoxy-manno-octulosonate cytidylyltransferase (CMP-KDO synthetase)